jgi:hypothetical protein
VTLVVEMSRFVALQRHVVDFSLISMKTSIDLAGIVDPASGMTLLHLACAHRRPRMVKWLLSHVPNGKEWVRRVDTAMIR